MNITEAGKTVDRKIQQPIWQVFRLSLGYLQGKQESPFWISVDKSEMFPRIVLVVLYHWGLCFLRVLP